MIAKLLTLPLAISLTLLSTACSERNPRTAPAPQSGTVQTRSSHYRAALDAYAAGRPERALEHFRAAAEQGNVNAQYYTGLMFGNGEGTKRNYVEAAKWYQRAAQHNHPEALVQLARLY